MSNGFLTHRNTSHFCPFPNVYSHFLESKKVHPWKIIPTGKNSAVWAAKFAQKLFTIRVLRSWTSMHDWKVKEFEELSRIIESLGGSWDHYYRCTAEIRKRAIQNGGNRCVFRWEGSTVTSLYIYTRKTLQNGKPVSLFHSNECSSALIYELLYQNLVMEQLILWVVFWLCSLITRVLCVFLGRPSSSNEVHHVCHGATSANLFTRRICNYNLCNHRIRISEWKIPLCLSHEWHRWVKTTANSYVL